MEMETGKFEVWNLKENEEEYKLLLSECISVTPYHQYEYLLAEEKAENYPIKIFVYREKNSYAMLGGIIRCINDLTYMPELDDMYLDFITPHEYAGIVSNSVDNNVYISLLKQIDNYFEANNVVYQFHRLNPYFSGMEKIYERASYQVIHSNYQVYIDLTQTKEEIVAQYKSNVKRNIKRAQKESLFFEISEKKEGDIKIFMKMYQKAMDILEAKKFLYFNFEYFKWLIKYENAKLVFVRNKEKKIIAGSIIILDDKNKIAYYHLGCFDRDYSLKRPMNYLIHSIIMWCKDEEYRKIHLGGGGESLHRFKAGYSEQRIDYYIASKINLNDKYREICIRWKEKFEEFENGKYLPLYRSNED